MSLVRVRRVKIGRKTTDLFEILFKSHVVIIEFKLSVSFKRFNKKHLSVIRIIMMSSVYGTVDREHCYCHIIFQTM